MNCKEIRELLPDLAEVDGIHRAAPAVEEHIASCEKCALDLREMQKTMSLLDEWEAPEPSAYFDTRMQARLREEMARPAVSWRNWFRAPAWAMSFAAVLFAGAIGIGVAVTHQSYLIETGSITTKPPALGLPVEPGTAVGDLQALDSNDDLYANFDTLDDLQVQDDVTANP
jgi:predicted anti-sigma-YlaC factor YlaD